MDTVFGHIFHRLGGLRAHNCDSSSESVHNNLLHSTHQQLQNAQALISKMTMSTMLWHYRLWTYPYQTSSQSKSPFFSSSSHKALLRHCIAQLVFLGGRLFQYVYTFAAACELTLEFRYLAFFYEQLYSPYSSFKSSRSSGTWT